MFTHSTAVSLRPDARLAVPPRRARADVARPGPVRLGVTRVRLGGARVGPVRVGVARVGPAGGRRLRALGGLGAHPASMAD